MTAPSKNFTVIADSAIDADSPITEGLMTDFRDNDINLEEWIGKDYVAAQNHDHDGVNSASVAPLIYSAQLTVANGAAWSVSTGALGFDPYAMVVNWAAAYSGANTYGRGTGFATGLSSQRATSILGTTAAALGNISESSASVMGQASATGGQFTAGFSEYADVTVWGSGGITIATQTGAWFASSNTIYINLQIWGK